MQHKKGNQTQLHPFPALTYTSIRFLHIRLVRLTLNYLCPSHHPLSLSLPPSHSLCPSPSLLSPSPDVCSPAALRWLRGEDWMDFYRACTHARQTDTHRVSHSDLLQQGSRTWVPEFKDFLSVFHFSTSFSPSMTTSI